jgi:hypothetical protein
MSAPVEWKEDEWMPRASVVTQRRTLVIESVAHVDEPYLLAYLDRDERKCIICGLWAEAERCWVKSPQALNVSPTYYLCIECLEKKPTLEWEGWRLKKVRFR